MNRAATPVRGDLRDRESPRRGVLGRTKPADGALRSAWQRRVLINWEAPRGAAVRSNGPTTTIADDEGNELPKDGVAFGRLLVKGPTIVERYFKSNQSAMDANGWFDTGDVAKIHPEGYMEIVDRSKDVIKSGGEWISSIDLENTAVGHPGVGEACVIGVLHEKWDERPVLLVVPANDKKDKESIYAFLENKIAKWWKPDDIVFVDELPIGATGKVLKIELREQFKDHLMK